MRGVRLDGRKLVKAIRAVVLPGNLHSRLTHAFILTGFLGFQVMDSVTTHLGLALQHAELNRLMAPLIAARACCSTGSRC